MQTSQRSTSPLDELAAKPGDGPFVPGTVMDIPLTMTWIFEHAMRNHGSREIVSKMDDGSVHRATFAEFGVRVAQLAHALVELGVKPGDRVATFAWSTYRHLELYYAVPMLGAVLHCVNIRLFPEQVSWVLDHADDKFVFVDASLAMPFAKALATRPGAVRPIVVMGEESERAAAKATLPSSLFYEDLLAGKSGTYAWPEVDERSAAVLCYTSATTGDPKGVAYTHRSQFLHALAQSAADGLNVRQRDVILPVVPMFHVNAWGLPYSAIMMGAKLVFAGQKLDPKSVIDLINSEGVTMCCGVPTVWLPVRDELNRLGLEIPTLKSLVIGGSACPPSLFDDLTKRGIEVIHAWGMTEMSPIGTMSRRTAAFDDMSESEQRAQLLKQGFFSPIVAWKLLDEDGNEVPRDGESRGELWVRGYAVTARYYGIPDDHPSFRDGYFMTGDVCTMDPFGFLQLVDRSKDLVKSGGEWISSVDLENEIMGHPKVREAAVIGVAHERWVERPVAVVVLRDQNDPVDEATLQTWLAERVAKWWVPDRVVFANEIPRTGVGKFLKRALREQYGDLLTGPKPG